MSNMSKELYYWYKEHGRCPRCGGEPVNGMVHCIDCLDKLREQAEKYQKGWSEEKRKHHNEQQREYCKRVREERKAAGLCVVCGKRKAYQTLMCGLCRNKHNKRRREKHRDDGGMTYEERIDPQRCYICGAPAVQGKRTCEKCLERERKIAENMRKYIKQSGFHKTREIFAR